MTEELVAAMKEYWEQFHAAHEGWDPDCLKCMLGPRPRNALLDLLDPPAVEAAGSEPVEPGTV